MFLIVGLGNPGTTYEKTRHNIGREILELFRIEADFSNFRFEKKWNALVTEGKVGKEKCVILLPNTFMNKSGSGVGAAMRFLKIKPKEIVVLHDDADIELGKTKLSFEKHSAGHKGVESVMRAIKTIAFWRIRIGIAGTRNVAAEKLVLKKFTPEEMRLVNKVRKKTVAALLIILTKGIEQAMNTYNQ